jgi:hypothetical protein
MRAMVCGGGGRRCRVRWWISADGDGGAAQLRLEFDRVGGFIIVERRGGQRVEGGLVVGDGGAASTAGGWRAVDEVGGAARG